MKKYLFIYKSELMSNLQYVFNILTGFIGYFIFIFVFLNLSSCIDTPYCFLILSELLLVTAALTCQRVIGFDRVEESQVTEPRGR